MSLREARGRFVSSDVSFRVFSFRATFRFESFGFERRFVSRKFESATFRFEQLFSSVLSQYIQYVVHYIED